MAKDTNILKAIPPIGWLAIIGAPTLYFGVLNPILIKLGLKDSTEDKKEKGEQTKNIKEEETKNYWNPNGWAAAQKKAGKVVTTISMIKAGQLADQIKDSFGTFNDHEEQIYAAFKQLYNKYDVSFLTWVYNNAFKTDLYNELKARLSKEEFNNVLNIVKRLK